MGNNSSNPDWPFHKEKCSCGEIIQYIKQIYKDGDTDKFLSASVDDLFENYGLSPEYRGYKISNSVTSKGNTITIKACKKCVRNVDIFDFQREGTLTK